MFFGLWCVGIMLTLGVWLGRLTPEEIESNTVGVWIVCALLILFAWPFVLGAQAVDLYRE